MRVFVGPAKHGQTGISYGLNGDLKFNAPFSECKPTYCFVDLKLSPKDIRSFSASSSIIISLGMTFESGGFTYTLANKGFKQSFDQWQAL